MRAISSGLGCKAIQSTARRCNPRATGKQGARFYFAAFGFHSRANRCALRLVRRGVAEKVAMMITGHKTASVFRRYDITNAEDVRAGRGKLAGTLSGTLTAIDGKTATSESA